MAVTESGHRASDAVDELYRRHGTEVYRYAFAVLGNRADAEDVTQTTFLNAYRSLAQGVRPRKPSNWLLAIASNAIKQRFRQEQARPRVVELDERTALAGASTDEEDGPTVGELLAALSKIPPQQRQAIVLREFEGRSYSEIADILGVTTSALETLLFRARRSLAEELEHQLTCTEAQLAISRAVDDRLGRKERRRLREHLAECPDCAHFARLQKRHRRALKGLMLLPVPLSLSFVKGIEGTATAATLPAAATTAGVGVGLGTASVTGGGAVAGGVALKAAAVVAAATVATGIGVTASSENGVTPPGAGKPSPTLGKGERIGQVAPRGVLVPGNGVARGKANAPGRVKSASARDRTDAKRAAGKTRTHPSKPAARLKANAQRSAGKATGQGKATPKARSTPSPSALQPKADKSSNTTSEPNSVGQAETLDDTSTQATTADETPTQPTKAAKANGGGSKAHAP